MSFKRYTLAFIATACVGVITTKNSLDYYYNKKGKIMTTQNYIADTMKKNDNDEGIDPAVIQAEVDKMLLEAKARGKYYEPKRIERPGEGAQKTAQRFDRYKEDEQQFVPPPSPPLNIQPIVPNDILNKESDNI
jgi:hypothetical protein